MYWSIDDKAILECTSRVDRQIAVQPVLCGQHMHIVHLLQVPSPCLLGLHVPARFFAWTFTIRLGIVSAQPDSIKYSLMT